MNKHQIWVSKAKVFRDERGYLFELNRGNDPMWVQENVSHSKESTVRGLHFQSPRPQAKLVTVLSGFIYDISVDVRHGSPTFGKVHVYSLDVGDQIYVPKGYAHGFFASQESIIHYRMDDYYYPTEEKTLSWEDPTLELSNYAHANFISQKDRNGKDLRDFSYKDLPNYEQLMRVNNG